MRGYGFSNSACGEKGVVFPIFRNFAVHRETMFSPYPLTATHILAARNDFVPVMSMRDLQGSHPPPLPPSMVIYLSVHVLFSSTEPSAGILGPRRMISSATRVPQGSNSIAVCSPPVKALDHHESRKHCHAGFQGFTSRINSLLATCHAPANGSNQKHPSNERGGLLLLVPPVSDECLWVEKRSVGKGSSAGSICKYHETSTCSTYVNHRPRSHKCRKGVRSRAARKTYMNSGETEYSDNGVLKLEMPPTVLELS